MRLSEPAPAKLNLALHVRGRRADGRHDIETLFAFCTDGDLLGAEAAPAVRVEVTGPFAGDLDPADNLVDRAASELLRLCGGEHGALLTLDKRLPVASGLGGGSADAAAALRLLTRLWSIDPGHAQALAPRLGSDVPACLLSLPALGTGAGDQLTPVSLPDIAGTPVLLVNPGVRLDTGAVFAGWDGVDRGPLDDWKAGRNDLEAPAIALVPAIADVLEWLRLQPGATFVRMSGSGATCFALFDSEDSRDRASAEVPAEWWHLATWLR